MSREEARVAAAAASSAGGVAVRSAGVSSLAFLESAAKKKRAEQSAAREETNNSSNAVTVTVSEHDVEEVARELDVRSAEAEALLKSHTGDVAAVFAAKIAANTPNNKTK